MKKIMLAAAMIISIAANAQFYLKTLPSGGNKAASVAEKIGITDVKISYSRPGVKGREGKIWGKLVPEGFVNEGFGSATASPWRAGANENTVISFSDDVEINGQALPAGDYGFFIAYNPQESTLIFSKASHAWGSYFYNEKNDAIRVKVKPVSLEKSVEWLSYSFSGQTENTATISLEWEKLSFPFQVKVDYEKTQLTSFRKELENHPGFRWQAWQQAASWCLQRNVNLTEALLWADTATSSTFGGDQEFSTWALKANILEKLGRSDEAVATMKKAMPIASITDLHQYGRQLISQKKTKEAMEIFTANWEKSPSDFTTLMGMARGNSAMGNYKEALSFLNKALPLSPDAANKKAISEMIESLKKQQDIN